VLFRNIALIFSLENPCYLENRVVREPGKQRTACTTLESAIEVGQGIGVGPGKFVKNNKHRALNKRRVSKFTKF
jgi:hypothetical protein